MYHLRSLILHCHGTVFNLLDFTITGSYQAASGYSTRCTSSAPRKYPAYRHVLYIRSKINDPLHYRKQKKTHKKVINRRKRKQNIRHRPPPCAQPPSSPSAAPSAAAASHPDSSTGTLYTHKHISSEHKSQITLTSHRVPKDHIYIHPI